MKKINELIYEVSEHNIKLLYDIAGEEQMINLSTLKRKSTGQKLSFKKGETLKIFHSFEWSDGSYFLIVGKNPNKVLMLKFDNKSAIDHQML